MVHRFRVDVEKLNLLDGQPVTGNGSERLKGCRDSEFDQYGDIAAFDIYPEVSPSEQPIL